MCVLTYAWILVTGARSPSPTLLWAACPSPQPRPLRELSTWFHVLPRVASMGSILAVSQPGRRRPGGPRAGWGPASGPRVSLSSQEGRASSAENRRRDRGHLHSPGCLSPRSPGPILECEELTALAGLSHWAVLSVRAQRLVCL